MHPLQNIKRFRSLGDLSHLIFPNVCLACERELARSESHVCSFCTTNLTPTNFHLFNEASQMDKLFWGRVAIYKTYAHLFFEKHKTTQRILFSLKYKNNPRLGVYFGHEIGRRLKEIPVFANADAFIPVPLHPKKQFIRGYNQSEALTKGICEILEPRMDIKTIVRTKHSDTQTRKSRFQRWDNVNEIFRVKSTILNYKHIVLVDDVITTGSTIEAIAKTLLEKNPKLSISVVTLAIA